jgi:hypothetical protein
MEHQDIEDHLEKRATHQGERKPYATPQLTEYGSLEVLTQSGSKGSKGDGGNNKKP